MICELHWGQEILERQWSREQWLHTIPCSGPVQTGSRRGRDDADELFMNNNAHYTQGWVYEALISFPPPANSSRSCSLNWQLQTPFCSVWDEQRCPNTFVSSLEILHNLHNKNSYTSPGSTRFFIKLLGWSFAVCSFCKVLHWQSGSDLDSCSALSRHRFVLEALVEMRKGFCSISSTYSVSVFC